MFSAFPWRVSHPLPCFRPWSSVAVPDYHYRTLASAAIWGCCHLLFLLVGYLQSHEFSPCARFCTGQQHKDRTQELHRYFQLRVLRLESYICAAAICCETASFGFRGTILLFLSSSAFFFRSPWNFFSSRLSSISHQRSHVKNTNTKSQIPHAVHKNDSSSIPRSASTTCSDTVVIVAMDAEIADVVLRLATKRKKHAAAAETILVKCKFRACLQLKTTGTWRNISTNRTIPPKTILNIRIHGGITELISNLERSIIIRGSRPGEFMASIEQMIELELSWKQIPNIRPCSTVDDRYHKTTFGRQDSCRQGSVLNCL